NARGGAKVIRVTGGSGLSLWFLRLLFFAWRNWSLDQGLGACCEIVGETAKITSPRPLHNFPQVPEWKPAVLDQFTTEPTQRHKGASGPKLSRHSSTTVSIEDLICRPKSGRRR